MQSRRGLRPVTKSPYNYETEEEKTGRGEGHVQGDAASSQGTPGAIRLERQK